MYQPIFHCSYSFFKGALAASLFYKDIQKHNKSLRMNRHKPKKPGKYSKWINALHHDNYMYKQFYQKLNLRGVQVCS